MSISSWISPISISWNPFPPTFFCHIHNLFHDFLDWFCHKFCEVMHNFGTQCPPIYCFGLDGFHSFLCNWWHCQRCNLSTLSCSIRVLFHNIDNPFHRVPCIMNLKGPSDSLICRLNRDFVFRGQYTILTPLVLNSWSSDWQVHCPTSREL